MLAIVLGTRPEIIKCAPIIHEAMARDLPVSIIHTGQHYTPELDEIFFRTLRLPEPRMNLHVGSSDPIKQITTMMQGLQPAFARVQPSAVLVQGDTNSVLAGALVAHKMNIPIAHLEAGLRSDDWSMPEEGNRVITGMLAELHFCPTDLQRRRLGVEGIVEGVHVVGNTIVDAVQHYADQPISPGFFEKFGIEPGRYILLTMHRPSNVDDPDRLRRLLECLTRAAETLGTRFLFPVHPRTEARIRSVGLWETYEQGPSFILTKPLGYIELLQLQKHARAVLTDSGGIQEEANILHVPCLTLRSNTERPETIEAGGNILFYETNPAALVSSIRELEARPRTWPCPFGDGKTAKRVLDILLTKKF
ncbi:MAG TPA: UDP-N-acetylglucosamine 2-epimerase (non-hydrolyzing), partial [Patescibacteria group bacterium]|nr:UDP-N-acetylglucosamine 2-epimerase (non-hydrolyzing) [Patescibacteria group bacterium]